MAEQDGRVAIVTGGNSGIGLETARELARKGATVVVASRSNEKGEAAVKEIRSTAGGGERVSSLVLDLAHLASIEKFVTEFEAQHDRLDLLINNAGVMMTPFGRTKDGFELQIGTNHLGHFALTARLIDRLVATENSRVINVSSVAHKRGSIDIDDLNWNRRRYDKWKAYQQSKLANLLFNFELDRRLRARALSTRAIAAHPGWTSTNLMQHMFSLAGAASRFLAMTPPQGALPILYAATQSEAQGGEYFGPDGRMEWSGYPTRVRSKPQARDAGMAQRLWTTSEELTEVELKLA